MKVKVGGRDLKAGIEQKIDGTRLGTKIVSDNGRSRQQHLSPIKQKMTSTPPHNGPKGEWMTPMRTRVLTLVENGIPASQISRETGVPASTVGRWKRAPHS